MREDFSQAVKEKLAKRVGFLCSSPHCSRSTIGPAEQPTASVNIGVAAHICAASPGGPRFDPSMSAEERTSFSNGIWLCQVCAKIIDSDVERYTLDVLRDWRRAAEEGARRRVENTGGQLSAWAPQNAELAVAYGKLVETLRQYINANSTGSGMSGTFPAIFPGHDVHSAVVEVEKHYPDSVLPPQGRAIWIRLLKASRSGAEESSEPGFFAMDLMGWAESAVEGA